MISEVFGKGEDRIVITSQSLEQFAALADQGVSPENASIESSGDPARYSGQGRERKNWYGSEKIKSMADVKAILDGGWKEGADRLTDLARELGDKVPTAKTRKRKATWKDDGADLDVDRALAGQWDTAYRNSQREWVAGPSTISLNVDWGGHCGQSAEELFWSGAVLAVLCDLLENAGYSVELAAFILTQAAWDGEKGAGVHQITIKGPSESLRIDALAGIVCHAGVFRSLGFRTLLQTPWFIGGGLGRMAGWEGVTPTLEKLGKVPEGICVQSVSNRAQAIAEISRVLASIESPA